LTRFRTPLALAVAIAAMLVAVAPAAAQSKDFYGVAPQVGLSAMTPRDYNLMQQVGVGSMRFLVIPQNHPSFRVLDEGIGAAAARGIRSMPHLFQKPGPRNRAQRRALARFAEAMARRYGAGGSYWQGDYQQRFGARAPMPIRSWQILNEQNGPGHWGARPSPRAYAQALRMTTRAIRRVNKRAEIVLGGMFFKPRGRGAMTSSEYLRRLYRLKGINVKRFFNSVAIHPYAPRLKGVRQHILRTRTVMRRSGHRKGRIRITELGWGSARGGSPFNKGLRGQARMLRKSFAMLRKNRKRWRIRGVHWFSWQDGTAPCKFCPSSGLLTAEGRAKPSLAAFQRAASRR
jgi:hypothetical protein